MSTATYAFVLNGSHDWRNSEVDLWDLDVIDLEGNEKIVGHRQLDGSICKVLKTADGKLVAITK
ncbi:hypothetical protein UFOVP1290_281 [uncultured Caudovirales phage]|uniref:Uncharacterized protein n=1 Tax=uncultured Caudovirales phage TaxID=2100421 RepID=A0A6J5RT38_9CAUD|nr:hypothetical protein UFOVP1290_281 [uncultured Caudovirales phage]